MTKVRSNYPEGVAWFPAPPLFNSSSSAGHPGASLHRSCGGFPREGSTKERRGFSLFPLHCSRGFTGFASRFPLPSGATRKRAKRGRVGCRTLTLAILWLRQEPITRIKQLPCTRFKAFFTFKSDLGANLEYLLSPTNQSVNPTDLKMVSLVELFMTFSFPQHTLYFECARVLTISCAKLTSALRHTVVSATFSGKYNKNQ